MWPNGEASSAEPSSEPEDLNRGNGPARAITRDKAWNSCDSGITPVSSAASSSRRVNETFLRPVPLSLLRPIRRSKSWSRGGRPRPFDDFKRLEAPERHVRRIKPTGNRLFLDYLGEPLSQAVELLDTPQAGLARRLAALPIGDRPFGKARKTGE